MLSLEVWKKEKSLNWSETQKNLINENISINTELASSVSWFNSLHSLLFE